MKHVGILKHLSIGLGLVIIVIVLALIAKMTV